MSTTSDQSLRRLDALEAQVGFFKEMEDSQEFPDLALWTLSYSNITKNQLNKFITKLTTQE